MIKSQRSWNIKNVKKSGGLWNFARGDVFVNRLKEFFNLSPIVDSATLSCVSKVSVEHPHNTEQW